MGLRLECVVGLVLFLGVMFLLVWCFCCFLLGLLLFGVSFGEGRA